MSGPTPAEAAERASTFLRKRAADLDAAGVPPIGPGVIASWPRTDDDADGDYEITAVDLQALVAHAYATGEPCDGECCEDGGAAHCHRCAEVDADNLLKERDRLRAIAEDHLAWARDQVEQTAAKFDQWADREKNAGLRMCMQFAARVMRAEFLGEYDEQQVNGRFAARSAGIGGVSHDAAAREAAERTLDSESGEP